MRLGTRQEYVGSSPRVSRVCQDGAREFARRRSRLARRLSGVAEKPVRKRVIDQTWTQDQTEASGQGLDHAEGARQEFARRFTEGIGKLARSEHLWQQGIATVEAMVVKGKGAVLVQPAKEEVRQLRAGKASSIVQAVMLTVFEGEKGDGGNSRSGYRIVAGSSVMGEERDNGDDCVPAAVASVTNDDMAGRGRRG
ncbi:hypothetical protein BHM03_00023128 [Ensete ventricosum]|nr:hypothetical protein BHM03_00023128 [Ensete ventricosum]